MKISMKMVYQYVAIFFNFKTTLNHLHPLQVENCDSNLRLVVDEDDNGKFRLERVKGRKIHNPYWLYNHKWYFKSGDVEYCFVTTLFDIWPNGKFKLTSSYLLEPNF